jgi:hypothetical protein
MRSHAIALLLAAMPACATAGTIAVPSDHYCGKLLSAGNMVDADTSLTVDPDGRISGTDGFRDGDTVTRGTLKEVMAGKSQMKMLRWADKYGDGWLVITFDSAFSRFDGQWGNGDAVPDNVWTGERCTDPNS